MTWTSALRSDWYRVNNNASIRIWRILKVKIRIKNFDQLRHILTRSMFSHAWTHKQPIKSSHKDETRSKLSQREQFTWPKVNRVCQYNNLHHINYEPKRQLSPFADAVGTDNSSDDQLPGSIFFRFTSTFVPIRFTRLLLGSITCKNGGNKQMTKLDGNPLRLEIQNRWLAITLSGLLLKR